MYTTCVEFVAMQPYLGCVFTIAHLQTTPTYSNQVHKGRWSYVHGMKGGETG